MAIQGYGNAPPRIGRALPTGGGIIQRQIAAGPKHKSISKPPPMATARTRLGRK